MDKLDRLIEEALADEDKEMLEHVRELGYLQLMAGLFRGRHGWWAWMIAGWELVFMVGGLACAVFFFRATEVLPALHWGLSAAVLMIFAVVAEISLAPQMQANRVIRELKRLELIIAKERDREG